MPCGDGTGPNGLGPTTGRRQGHCAGFDRPGFQHGHSYGRGCKRGYHLGRGCCNDWNQQYPYQNVPYPEVSEKTLIENEVKVLGEQLKALETRLKELQEKE